jgi:protein-S-isoprenylcysteine O-methyltransferase Ste14
MKNGSKIESFLLSNPFHRGMVESFILVGSGICGLIFSWAKFSVSPASNILGGLLIFSALLFHRWAEKEHKQAHEKSENVSRIVNSGIYSKIRHPL